MDNKGENGMDKLLDHNYDGIQEYDNDLPRWWLSLFWLGIIFGFVYVGYYHFGGGEFKSTQLAAEMSELKSLRTDIEAEKSKKLEKSFQIATLLEDQTKMGLGAEVYVQNCLPCHGDKGQGIVGPNLTDDYWLHGGNPLEIRKTIVEGVIEKGMVAWGPILGDEKIDAVTAYIWSLHGSNPPNPKEPQGELEPREG